MNGNMKKIILFICILLIIAIIVYTGSKSKKEYNFKMYFFNAGKADSVLISNNDKYILIDTGEDNLSDEILTYLKNNNITKIDYLIITHFDKDHVGSASSIIDNIEVENVLQSNVPKESIYYNNYLSSLNIKGITPQTISGDIEFSLGDLDIKVNGPTIVYDNNDSNNSSLIVSIKYGNTNYLFTGDIQNERIKDYITNNTDTYDFLKIPYHGHYQKKLDDLIEVVKPKYAVITSSTDEPEDDKTIELLKNKNISYYLTRNGSITVLSDGNDIIIKQQ